MIKMLRFKHSTKGVKKMATNVLMAVVTPPCFYCGAGGMMKVSSEGYLKRLNGAAIQEAYPDLSAGEREQMMTGTHPACWNAAYGKGK
jgi:hypothetical protein